MAEKLRTLDFGDGKGARVLVPDWDNVDNKPFGEVITTLVDNQTITLSDGQGMITPSVELVVGKEYTVIYNGTEYKTTAVAMTTEYGTGAGIGNASVFGGEDTGEPFIAGSNAAGTMIIALDGSAEVVLSIIGPVIKTIDRSYVPLPTCFYAKNSTADVYLYADENLTRKVTALELEAVQHNFRVIIKTGSFPAIAIPMIVMVTSEFGTCSIGLASGGTILLFEKYTAEYIED